MSSFTLLGCIVYLGYDFYRSPNPFKSEGVVGEGARNKIYFNKMYYNYVLKSEKDGKRYIGFTSDLKKRLREHNEGLNKSTKNRRPLVLIYYEAGLSKKDAIIREKYLKTEWGNRYLNKRLENEEQ